MMQEIIGVLFNEIIPIIIGGAGAYMLIEFMKKHKCRLGLHELIQEGMAYSTPIEYHFVCLKCGITHTVYRKSSKTS
ncbi:MAG: hypothetical protein ACFE96_15620 [Candidatus Hermodarchaeota archaeon]